MDECTPRLWSGRAERQGHNKKGGAETKEEVFYCAGVCWIQIKCRILFQGRDENLMELTLTVWPLESLFSSREGMYRTLALASSPSTGSTVLEEGRVGTKEGNREPADNSLIFMCAR